MVLRLGIDGAASGDSFGDEVFHLGPAFAAQAIDHLNGFRSVADGLRCELQKLRMREHHDMDVLADDNARRRVVRELRVVREAESFEKRERPRKIRDGQIDEDLGDHESGGMSRRLRQPVQSNDEQDFSSRTGRTRFCEKNL